MIHEPSLEIVVPYYRGAAHLLEALRSVLAQEDPVWLLTVIDDASPDHDAQNLVDCLDDPRVRYLRHDQNKGISETFNHALQASRGQWTVIMGQDDRLLPGYVRTVRNIAATAPEQVSMIQPGVRVIDVTGIATLPLVDRVKSTLRLAPSLQGGQSLAASLLVGNWLYFPSVAWRTRPASSIGFRPDLLVTMDLQHVLQQICAGHQLAITNSVVFEYRRHASSESSRAAAGYRFEEERRLHGEWAGELHRRGWWAAAVAARLRPTSRLHAGHLRLAQKINSGARLFEGR